MRSTHVERAILVRVYGIICRLQADNAATRDARIWYENQWRLMYHKGNEFAKLRMNVARPTSGSRKPNLKGLVTNEARNTGSQRSTSIEGRTGRKKENKKKERHGEDMRKAHRPNKRDEDF